MVNIPKRNSTPALARPAGGDANKVIENAFALTLARYDGALRTLAQKEGSTVKTEDKEFSAELLLACRTWWEGHRPLAFTAQEHLKNPTVNTTGDGEKGIAVLVAKAIDHGLIELGD